MQYTENDYSSHLHVSCKYCDNISFSHQNSLSKRFNKIVTTLLYISFISHPDQTYFFRVRAVNKVGESAPSLQSCFVTPGEEWGETILNLSANFFLDENTLKSKYNTELLVIFPAAVEDRQNAMLEMRRKREEEEEARRQALLEEERRQGKPFSIYIYTNSAYIADRLYLLSV